VDGSSTRASGPIGPGAETRAVPAGGVPVLAQPDDRAAPVAQLLEGHEVLVLGRRGVWVHVDAGGGVDGWVDGRVLAGTPGSVTVPAPASGPSSASDPPRATSAAPRRGMTSGSSWQIGFGPVLGALGGALAIVGALLPWQQRVVDRLVVNAFDIPVTFLGGWEHLGDGGFSLGALLVIVAGIGVAVSVISGGGVIRRVLGFVVVVVCAVYVLQQQSFLTSNDLGVGTGLNVWDVADYGVVVSFLGGLVMTFAPSR
jgi:hypothetical protein